MTDSAGSADDPANVWGVLRRASLASFGVVVLLSAACGPAEEITAISSEVAVVVSEELEDAEKQAATTVTTMPRGPSFDFSEAESIVEEFVVGKGLNGAALTIVHRDHGIIFETFFGVYDKDRISLIASSSKMVSAGVLLALQDQGLLDVDKPIADFVAWGSGNPEITTAQLLSNSSGLIGLFQDLTYSPYLCIWNHRSTLQQCAEQVMTTTEDDGLVISPDTTFHYGGAQWQVAGGVAEAVSGKSWSQLVDEIFVQPCGLEVFGFNNPFSQLPNAGFEHPAAFQSNPEQLEDTDNPNIEAGAYSNSRDYAALMLMHLRDGMCGHNRVLSPDALSRLHQDRVREVYDGNAYSDGSGYAMGWWIDRASGRLTDTGAYGSSPWLDLEDGYGVLLLTESSSSSSSELAALLFDVIDQSVARGIDG
ncbi:MAG: beta-lactamase family protein [Acidimicrobiaceae bacterium]|nr:beta-lactamase family protein [Acidimicrobiaceae bacterium]MBT5849500.1 beta-lactamase family protein [Acidimicrobiaceae bacterium]